MKDRAGTVGFKGVGPMLQRLLTAGQQRTHLIGHSYGAKVVLSATAAGNALPRPVTSMLLLQPAVSHLCFADQVPGTSHPGGYRKVLTRVDQPILSTFSKHDFALTKLFHLALRRKSDLGEIKIGGTPSKYAALGGFGPNEAHEERIDIKTLPASYNLGSNAPEVYGIKADQTIKGHGDISNLSTWWALYNLVRE